MMQQDVHEDLSNVAVLMKHCGIYNWQKFQYVYPWSCAGPTGLEIRPIGDFISGSHGNVVYYFFRSVENRNRFSRAIFMERAKR